MGNQGGSLRAFSAASRASFEDFQKGSLRWSTWTTYEERDKIFVGSSRERNKVDETVQVWHVSTDLEYSFCPDWSASLTLSYLDIFQRIDGSGVRNREHGVGDTVVLAHWTALDTFEKLRAPEGGTGDEFESMEKEPLPSRPSEEFGWLREPTYWLMFDFGTSLPTGKTRRPKINAESGTPFSSLQRGTGTLNPVLGAHFRTDWGGIALSLDASAMIPFYENRFDFQSGDFQNYTIGFEFAPVSHSRFALGFDFEHQSRDQIDNEKINVGGGWRYALHPQIILIPFEGSLLFVGAHIPLYRKFDTFQLDYDVRWEIGFQINF